MIRKKKRHSKRNNDRKFKEYRMEYVWNEFIKADTFQPKFPWEMKILA